MQNPEPQSDCQSVECKIQLAYHRAILEAMEETAIVSFSDLDGNIIKANRIFCEVTGYSESELLGQNHRIVNSGFHPTRFWKNMWDTISAGKTWRSEVCNRKKDGSLYWVDSVVNPIYDEHGKIHQYLSIRYLITDKKRAEVALRESEKQFRTLFEEAPVSVFIQDKDTGEIVDANRLAYESYGFSNLEELKTNQFWMDTPFSFEDALAKVRKAAESGMQQFEWLNQKRNGELFWEYIKLIPMKIQGEDRIVATALDITDRKLVETEIIRARDQAERAKQELELERERLSSALELINREIGFAELLQDYLTPERPNWKRFGIDVSVLFEPLDRVSGDIYDFFQLSPYRFRFFIADATGHGLQAGFQTMCIQTEYQRIKDEMHDPGMVVYHLNESIHKTFPKEPIHYSCLVLDVDLEMRKIYYSSAGHPEPILLTGEKTQLLPVTTPIMGVLRHSNLRTSHLPIPGNFRLVLYTDGITEVISPEKELFDFDRILGYCKANRSLEPCKLIEGLKSELDAFRGGDMVFDDRTMIVVDFQAPKDFHLPL